MPGISDSDSLVNASPCLCCAKPEHRHLPQHPLTWHLKASSGAVSGISRTAGQFGHPDGFVVHWNSRSHRKGRNPVLKTTDGRKLEVHRPPFVLLNLDVGNISWWLGAIFTVASAVWVVNGWFSFAPMSNDLESDIITGITALIGGGMFIIGGYLGVLESLNVSPSIHLSYILVKDEPGGDNTATAGTKAVATAPSPALKDSQGGRTSRKWRFWGWEPRSLAFLANFSVLIGALIFYIPCITGYYPISNRLSPAATDILFWLPQVLASTLFVLSGVMLMLEVQEKWYLIKLADLGWQSAFWNFIGGLGFLLCGAFGFGSQNAAVAKWGASFSTLWGSVAFLIGSFAQWIESMNPYDLSA